jgi:hypothetical protein
MPIPNIQSNGSNNAIQVREGRETDSAQPRASAHFNPNTTAAQIENNPSKNQYPISEASVTRMQKRVTPNRTTMG